LANVVVAEVLTDTAEKYETGAVKKLFEAGEMTVTASQDKVVVWLDNKPVVTMGREANSEISVSGSAISDTMQAELFGKDIDATTGVILDSGDFVEKYYAFGAEVGNYGGKPSYVWFLKTSLSIPDEANKTEDESTDWNGSSITVTAQKTVHEFAVGNGKKSLKRVVFDPNKSELVEGADWFAKVVTPEELSKVAKKKTAAAE
jgi:phi13 family phage major tail protein